MANSGSDATAISSLSGSNYGERRSPSYYKFNFVYTSTVMCLNHAFSLVVVAFVSSTLGYFLGGLVNGLALILYATSNLSFAIPFTTRMGFKRTIFWTSWGMTIHMVLFYFSIGYDFVRCPLIVIGSCVGGVARGFFWTAKGVYLEQTSIFIYETTPEYKTITDIDLIRTEMEKLWTVVFHIVNAVVFVIITICNVGFNIPLESIFAGYCIVCGATSLMVHSFDSLQHRPTPISRGSISEWILKVPLQSLRDVRISLLIPLAGGYGTAAAMFADYVNLHIVTESPTLHVGYVGALEALSYLVSGLMATIYPLLPSKTSGTFTTENVTVVLGALCFFICGAIVAVWTGQQLSAVGAVVILRVLFGLGTGSYESAVKDVHLNIFQGDDLTTSLMAQTVASALWGAICFFIYASIPNNSVGYITLVTSVFAILGFLSLASLPVNYRPYAWSNLVRRRQSTPLEASLINQLDTDFGVGADSPDTDFPGAKGSFRSTRSVTSSNRDKDKDENSLKSFVSMSTLSVRSSNAPSRNTDATPPQLPLLLPHRDPPP